MTPQRIAVLGGGPSGAACATLLARAGRDVVLFGAGRRPKLLVGESLIPAVVPHLRTLGIEEAIAADSVRKPGASFATGVGEPAFRFTFDVPGLRYPHYAYSTPRDRFDDAILGAARDAGVHFVQALGTVEADGDRVALTGGALDAARELLGGAPDWIVDATGRTRLLATKLALPTEDGPRKDAALFAHLEGVDMPGDGFTHNDLLQRGWAWRIPLPGRTSVGVVAPVEHLAPLGETAEERFDAACRSEPWLAQVTASARRVTPVLRYDNYQRLTARSLGPNWCLVGDALGFVDPVLSSGTYLALEGGVCMAEALLTGSRGQLRRTERVLIRRIRIWQEIIGYFYDGRLLTLCRAGKQAEAELPGGEVVGRFMTRHLTGLFTGESIESWFSLSLLRFMIRHGRMGHEPDPLMVR